MDELQFRRRLYEDPNAQDAEIVAARKDNPAREQFAKDIEALDRDIAEALRVPVPEELSDKLILRQAMASHQHDKRKNRVHFALAASVAIAFGVLFNFLQFSSAYTNIGDYALAHVYHEEGVFSNDGEAKVTLASLNKKMTSFNGVFASQIGELMSADYCRFDGIKSLHLVFKGETAPVNVFVVPERTEVSFTSAFEDNRYHGSSMRMGDNHVIVVGEKNEEVQKWRDNLSNSTQWSI